MHSKLADILATNNAEILTDQQLLDYINNKLTDEERYELEKIAVDNDMGNDALEGLALVKNKEQILKHKAKIVLAFQEKLQPKKQKRSIKNISVLPAAIIITVGILLLSICVWFIINLIT